MNGTASAIDVALPAAVLSPDVWSFLVWTVLFFVFMAWVWQSYRTFDQAIRSNQMPSDAASVFHKRVGVAFALMLVVDVAIWFFREPVFYDWLNMGGA